MRHLAHIAVAMLALACSVPQQTGESTPSPTEAVIEPGEVERSDAFWQQNSDFVPTAYRYNSLAEITASAHLVVRGRVTGTREGELQSFNGAVRRTIFGIVVVDEVLKGTPEMQIPGAVLVARLGAPEQQPEQIPAGEVVLFLMHYPQMRAENNVGPSKDPDDRFFYGRPNGYQCVLRNISGVVRIIEGPEGWVNALGPFPAPLDGEPFEGVVQSIRDMVTDA